MGFQKKAKLLLVLIFIIAVILRFYRLGDVPVGLHRDEAFLGYNAYSILQTGKDMNGNFLPLHLESFIYSPAGYSYLSIPFIAVFDLNAFSVRFASALFGSLTVVVSYFLVRHLFHPRGVETLALISAGLFAINPWHINLSRTATENIIVVFFITLGTLLFILWTRKDKVPLLVLSFLFFGATLLIYQAPRAFLPFFIPLLILVFVKFKLKDKRLLFVLGLFLTTIILPLILIFSSKELSLRARTVSLFATEETRLIINDNILTDGVFSVSRVVSRAFHNKLSMYTQQFLDNYFSHFSYQFLFTDQGFPDRYRVPLIGLLYIFELPLLIVGTFSLWRTNKKVSGLLFGWIFLSFLGSGLTFDDIPNLQRSVIVFPALSITTAYGAIQLIPLLTSKRIWMRTTLSIFLFLAFYNIIFYLHQYYIHFPVYRPWYRHDGYKELVVRVNELLPDYKKAVITNRESAPTIFFLFYTKYEPHIFQEETKNSILRDFDRVDFGKYEFSQEECPLRKYPAATGVKNILYVNYGTCKLSENYGRELTQIKRSDGSLVFRILSLIL